MAYSSSASEEKRLPEVFRRLGKTAPPREKQSYSANRQTSDVGLRIVRPTSQEQSTNLYLHQPNFRQSNYPDMSAQSSNSPPLYYRSHLNSEGNTIGFHTGFSPNNNVNTINGNTNNSVPIPYHHSSSPSTSSSPSPSIPQNAFSFIPKDVNPSPNSIISFVRNPNANVVPPGYNNIPYQYYNNSMNQVSMNNDQPFLHQVPPVPTLAASSSVAADAVASNSESFREDNSSGIPEPSPKASKLKKSTFDDTATSSFSPRKSEQEMATRHISNDSFNSNGNDKKDTLVNQRDILAKSIKIIASRPRGLDKDGSVSSRKHTYQNDTEESESEKETTVNRKIVVASNNDNHGETDKNPQKSPIRKRIRRSISPTIPKRRGSLSDDSDQGVSTKRQYANRSRYIMSVARRSRSRSHSRSRSRSRSPSPSRRTRIKLSQRRRSDSPGSSSDEEKAPFLRRQADRYVPDYVRRPLPPQFRRRSSSPVKKSSRTTSSSSTPQKSTTNSTTSSSSSSASINNRLNLNSKPKDLRSYPPLGTSPFSSNNYKTRADIEASSSSSRSPAILNTASLSESKQAPSNKVTPISHKIITKPSPIISKTKTSLKSNNNDILTTTACNIVQLKTSPSTSTPHDAKNDKLIPIKQEISFESTNEKTAFPLESSNVANTVSKANDTTTVEPTDASTLVAKSKHNNAPAATATAPYPKNAPITDAINNIETMTQGQSRKHRVLSNSLIMEPGKEETIASNDTTITPTAIDIVLPSKNTPTITEAKRAAIKKRAAMGKELLDQERLRQLDIDDRDDIVMDIALPTPNSSLAEKMTNHENLPKSTDRATSTTSITAINADTIATATTDSEITSITPAILPIITTSNINTVGDPQTLVNIPAENTDLVNSSIITVAPPAPSAPPQEQHHHQQHHQRENVIPLHKSVDHTTTLNMTSHEKNVHSSDTITIGTNSAFTDIVSSSFPEGNTAVIEQIKSMPSEQENIQLLTPPPASQLQAKGIVASQVASSDSPPSTVPLKKNKRKRLPSPWKVKMSDSGDIYYHNPVTGEETFARPE